MVSDTPMEKSLIFFYLQKNAGGLKLAEWAQTFCDNYSPLPDDYQICLISNLTT